MAEKIRVLYVDDERDLLEIGKMFLENTGDFNVTTALSATNAIRLLEQGKFDAIISDYQMPGMDGIQFLVEVRSRFGSIPFILFTGRGREEVVIQAINSGADFYLQKGGEPGAQFAELSHKIKMAASRKRADDALRKSEEKYRHLIEHSNEAIVVAQDGMLKLVNHRAVEFTGYSEQELLSMQFSAFIHADDRAMVVERYQKRMNGEELPSHYAFRLSSKDGRTRWVEISIVVIDWDGRPATLNFLTDITERKRADDSLKEEQQFSKLILDSLPGIFYLYTYPENRMVRWNKQHETLLGYTAEEIKGKLGTDLHLPEHKDAVLNAIEVVMEKGQSSVESTLMAKDGHQIPFFFTGVRFEAPDQLYFMGIGIDITERKRAEEALLKNTEELHASYEELTASEEELRQNVDDLAKSERALRESEEKFHSLYLHMIEGAALHELTYDDQGIPEDYIIIETNPAFERQLGISRDAVIGKTSREAYGLTEPPFLEIYARVALTGKPEIFEMYFPPLAKHFSISAYSPGKGRFATIFEDITKGKLAGEALKESEERFRLTLDAINDGIWDWDIPTGTAFFSPRWYTMLGYAPDEMPGSYATWRSLIHPEDIGPAEQIIQGHTERGVGGYRVEFRMRTKDGSWKWILTRGQVVEWDADNKPVRMVGTHTDITERKRAEDSLKKSEQQFRALSENSQDYIMRYDKEHRHTYANPACLRAVGMTAEQFIGKTHHELGFPPDLCALWEPAIDRVFATGQPFGETFAWTGVDGEVVLNWQLFPEKDDKGEVISVLGVSRDITKYMRMEVQTRDSEQKFHTIFDASGDGMLLADIETHRFVNANTAIQKMTGYTETELLDLTISDIHPTAELPHVMGQFEKMVRGESYLLPEVPVLRKDGTIFYCDISSSAPVNIQNRHYLLGIFRDITEIKRAEAALRYQNEMRQTILDSLPVMVALFDREGHYQFINRCWQSTLGWSLEEMRQSKDFFGELYPDPDYKTYVMDYIKKAAGAGCWSDFKTCIHDGHVLDTSWINVPLSDGSIIGIGIDITERKREEDALRVNEKRLQMTQEIGHIGSWEYDIKTNQMWGSEEGCHLFGYPRIAGSFPIENFASCITEPELVLKAFNDLINEGKEYDLDFVINPKDGSAQKTLHSIGILEKDERGNPVKVKGINQDITERKVAEEKLRESEEKYRSLFENMLEGFAYCRMLYDENGSPTDFIYLNVNPAFDQITGSTTVVGKPVTEVYPGIKEAFPELLEIYGRVAMTGIPESFDLDFKPSEKWLHISVHSTTKEHFVAVFEDITERKRTEEALRESEGRYRNVVEDQTEFICRFLPDGTHIFVNDAYCRYFDKKREEIVGHRFSPKLHPEDREPVARHLASLTPEHPVMDIEQRIILPDGSLKWQRWSDRAIFDPNGRVVEYQSVGRDITEQKELEKEMDYHALELRKFSTALTTANRKLTLLSSITRHDINNKLAVLQGYLEILKNTQLDPSQTDYCQKVTTAAQRISAMIQFTKEYENIGVNAPVWQGCRTLVDTAAKQAPLGQVMVKNDLPPETEVFADSLIVKVFYNLMDNAARYGGKITTIRFSAEERDGDHLIICEDDGDGVIAEEKEKIFERGFGKNTGMGLFLAQEILSITGITIRETGEPGKGAQFEITVPKGVWRMHS